MPRRHEHSVRGPCYQGIRFHIETGHKIGHSDFHISTPPGCRTAGGTSPPTGGASVKVASGRKRCVKSLPFRENRRMRPHLFTAIAR